MITSYKILFSVDILNDYYKNGLCADFKIIPSDETALLMRNMQLVYKNIGNRAIVLTKLKRDTNPAEDGKPFIPVNTNAKFVFYMSLNRPEFSSLTNVDLDGLRSQRFYFSNLNQNKHQTFSHLTAVIEDYDNARQYEPGDFADDGTKKIFECIKATTGHNTSNTSFWVSRDDIQYASPLDFVQPVNTILNYTAPVSAADFTMNVFGFDVLTNDYTKLALHDTLTFTNPVKDIQLDLSKLAKGKYRININGDDFFIYVDDEMIYSGYFGVIEIFSLFPNGDDFSFLDVNGKPAEKEFFIRFANRLATWKYFTPKHTVTGITHPANKYTFTQFPSLPAVADFFQSDIPVPLTELPERFDLHLSPQISNSPPRAPGPDVSIPGAFSKTIAPDNDFYCNIYLNY